MEEFDEIWTFVEHKIGAAVPVYFKNILKVCGFNNGITIASIVEEDIKYFESEVQNGNVTKAFNDGRDVLEGSIKSRASFEFTRGHEKFLLAIVDMLKKHLSENGPDSFIVKKPTKKTVKSTKNKPVKRLCQKKNISNAYVTSVVESAMAKQKLSEGDSAPCDEDIKEHKQIILFKIVKSLMGHTRDKFDENIHSIKKKMAKNLLKIEEKPSENDSDKDSVAESDEEVEINGKCVKTARRTEIAAKYRGIVTCPFGCIKSITVFHTPTIVNSFLWNTSNFDRHLKLVHKSQDTRKDSIIAETTTNNECESKANGSTEKLSISYQDKSEEKKESDQDNDTPYPKVDGKKSKDFEPPSMLNESVQKKKRDKARPSVLTESDEYKQGVDEKKRKKKHPSLLDEGVEEKKLEKIQVNMSSESDKRGVDEKQLKKRKKNKSKFFGESFEQDFEEGKPEKIQFSLSSESYKRAGDKKQSKKRERNQPSMFDESVEEKQLKKVQASLSTGSDKRGVDEKEFKKCKKNKPKLLDESFEQDLEEGKPEKIQFSLSSESYKRAGDEKQSKKRKRNQPSMFDERVEEKKLEKIQVSLPNGSDKRGVDEKELKECKMNKRKNFIESFEQDFEEKNLGKMKKIQPGVEENKREKIRPSLLNESVKQDVVENTLEKRKKNQTSLLIESVKQSVVEKQVEKHKKNTQILLGENSKKRKENKKENLEKGWCKYF